MKIDEHNQWSKRVVLILGCHKAKAPRAGETISVHSPKGAIFSARALKETLRESAPLISCSDPPPFFSALLLLKAGPPTKPSEVGRRASMERNTTSCRALDISRQPTVVNSELKTPPCSFERTEKIGRFSLQPHASIDPKSMCNQPRSNSEGLLRPSPVKPRIAVTAAPQISHDFRGGEGGGDIAGGCE